MHDRQRWRVGSGCNPDAFRLRGFESLIMYFMNRKQQGDIGVAQAIFYYTKQGYVVSVPATDNSLYDLLVDNGNAIKRI
jgi:hypothetical protein